MKREDRQRCERVDKNHRFPLRIDQDLHNEAGVITFKYNLSLNLLYNEAIRWALNHSDFINKVEYQHGNRVNPKRGHFIYVRDWRD